MRIPKIRASWIDPPPPNTPSGYGREEPRYLRADALGVVLHQEVPGVGENHDVAVGDLLLEAVRPGDRRIVVLLAPQHHRRDAEFRELALVLRELLEVARSVQGEPGASALDRREALPVLVDGLRLRVGGGLLHEAGEPVAVHVLDQLVD